jgi:hypothetical protein
MTGEDMVLGDDWGGQGTGGGQGRTGDWGMTGEDMGLGMTGEDMGLGEDRGGHGTVPASQLACHITSTRRLDSHSIPARC